MSTKVENIQVERIDSLPFPLTNNKHGLCETDQQLMTWHIKYNPNIDKYPSILQMDENCGFYLEPEDQYQFIKVYCSTANTLLPYEANIQIYEENEIFKAVYNPPKVT